MSVNLGQVNAITSNTYGFDVLDWDSHRDGCLIAKCSIGEHYVGADDISELPQTLEGKTAEEIAAIFNQIFQKFHFRELSGVKFEAKSLNMRVDPEDAIPVHPYIFVCGNKI